MRIVSSPARRATQRSGDGHQRHFEVDQQNLRVAKDGLGHSIHIARQKMRIGARCHADQILAARVEEALERPALVAPPPDCALLDPPRLGLPARALEALAAIAPTRIAYLSCDPATLARDLRRLTARGYALRRVEAFDLFPQTAHVETLALLSKSDHR